MSETDRFSTHKVLVEYAVTNDTSEMAFTTTGFVLLSAGDPHYVTADDRLVTGDEFGRVVMGESRTFRVDGFHEALGDPTVLLWVNVTHVATGASALFRPGGPVVVGPLRDHAIVTQTAVATFDGSDYVEVSFTETPEGTFASVNCRPERAQAGHLAPQLPRSGDALNVADCRALSLPHIRRMCNIDASHLGMGYAQMTTAIQSLSNNVKILPPATANGSSPCSSGGASVSFLSDRPPLFGTSASLPTLSTN